MLFAGAGAWNSPDVGGALPFNVNNSPLWEDWDFGSANKCSLLVRVLPSPLPFLALCRFLWPILRRGRPGTSVPLIAGACADNTSALGGAFAFIVRSLPSAIWWATVPLYNVFNNHIITLNVNFI